MQCKVRDSLARTSCSMEAALKTPPCFDAPAARACSEHIADRRQLRACITPRLSGSPGELLGPPLLQHTHLLFSSRASSPDLPLRDALLTRRLWTRLGASQLPFACPFILLLASPSPRSSLIQLPRNPSETQLMGAGGFPSRRVTSLGVPFALAGPLKPLNRMRIASWLFN